MPEPSYPEHEKMAKIKPEADAISGFIDWLREVREPRVSLRTYNRESGEWVHAGNSLTELLAEHFTIDLKALELEKQAMIEGLSDRMERRHP